MSRPKNISWRSRNDGAQRVRSVRNSLKKTELVTLKVTKSVAATRSGKLEKNEGLIKMGTVNAGEPSHS